MSVTILRADALALPLADSSVDLVITSPPYFGLRSYQDGGEHYEGQIGSEATPTEFLDALIAATREMVRVLKPSGSIFVNLGDKYVVDNRGSGSDYKRGAAKWAPAGPAGYPGEGVMPRKSLMLLPERYRIRAVDELGLIARAVVIWSKPNGLPESVTDRVRRSHEQWFHFTKEPRYFSAVDEIREPHKSEPGREGKCALGGQKTLRPVGPNSGNYNTLGALPGSVWTIPTEPLRVPESLNVDHFTAFPTEWPRRIIQGWSPRGVCTACGFLLGATYDSGMLGVRKDLRAKQAQGPAKAVLRQDMYPDLRDALHCPHCGCDRLRPAVIADPFGGTGTTALVADALGRHGITADLSADYCRLAGWRTTDPKQRAKAARVEAVEPVSPDQLSLFEESA